MTKHRVLAQNAERIADWLAHRGGIIVWKSLQIGGPTGGWTTPVRDSDGAHVGAPHWSAQQDRVITDPDEVEISVPKLVKKFRIAVRRGSQGLALKLTDHSSKKVRTACDTASEKYGAEAWYTFDYDTQEAEIWVDHKVIPLEEWLKKGGASAGPTNDLVGVS